MLFFLNLLFIQWQIRYYKPILTFAICEWYKTDFPITYVHILQMFK